MASSECNDTVGNSGETQPQHTRLPHRLPAPILPPSRRPHFPQPVKSGLPPKSAWCVGFTSHFTRWPDHPIPSLCSSWRRFRLALDVVFFAFNLNALAFDVEPQPVEDRHVLICHPDQGEQPEQVSAPIRENQLVAGDDKEECRDPMAEAVLAGKQIKEFPDKHMPSLLATARAEFARLTEDLFMCNGPANARDRQ